MSKSSRKKFDSYWKKGKCKKGPDKRSIDVDDVGISV